MAKHGKKYEEAAKLIEANKLYDPAEAIELAKKTATSDLQAIILLGVQSPADLLYGEDFITFAEQHPNIKFHAFYSRIQPETPKSFEHPGYVQHYFETLQLEPAHDVIYLCGNPNMIDDAFAKLQNMGFETKNVRREKYISPKK